MPCMTINEYLQGRTRTINTVKWVGIGIAVFGGLLAAYLDQPKALSYGSILAPLSAAIAVMILLSRRLRCPWCKGDLTPEFLLGRGRMPLRYCQKCGANFDQEMPNDSIGQ